MLSEIVERTPSVYFKFEDQSHRNYSKSSLVFDLSISNQKAVSRRAHNLKANSALRQQSNSPNPYSIQNKSITPGKYFRKKQPIEQDQFMALYGCKDQGDKNTETKLKTQQFFEEFQQHFVITFDDEDPIFVNEWNSSITEQSKISKGNLNFAEYEVEQTMKHILIDSNKNSKLNQNEQISQLSAQNLQKAQQSGQNVFQSQILSNGFQQNEKTERKKSCSRRQKKISNLQKMSSAQMPSNKQNYDPNCQNYFDQIISFGPANTNKSNAKQTKSLKTNPFMTKDFDRNSSIFQKNYPLNQTKRRMASKNIENLVNKTSKERNRSQTRKKPIINTDLLISTINKTQKTDCHTNNGHTNNGWSNPLNNKKSSSLECTFTYDNMFKTNAFRETLKSTTLQNWKKKYHMRIDGDKKTVTKRKRDVNIFNNLFIRA